MSLHSLVSLIKAKAAGAERVVVALSGGVDSGLVAFAAHEALGTAAVAATVVSELTPQRDRQLAEAVAAHIGIEHRSLTISVLSEPAVRANAPDRCYHCKRTIFQGLTDAFGPGCLFLDGTNADDDPARPGLRAVKEYDVFSPLREAGLTKSAVREISRQVGMPNWDAPSESCLATRIAHGTELTEKGLQQVEALESFCHELGVETIRCRPDNLVATVEHLPQYTDILMKNRDKIVALAQRIGLRSCEFKEWSE